MTERNSESPPMHDAYYRARKLYIFFSLLLFSHELIGLGGVDIKDVIKGFLKKAANIEVGEFTSPGALVAGYFFLWAYSFVHFVIEWHQAPKDRIKAVASKWDRRLTHSIAIIALTVLGIQQEPDFQVAKRPLEFLLPFFFGLFVPFIAIFWKRSTFVDFNDKGKKRYNIKLIVLFIITSLITVGLAVGYLLLFNDNLSFIVFISLAGGFFIGMITKDALNWPSSSTSTPGDPVDPPDSHDSLEPSKSPATTETTEENNKPEARSTKSEINSKPEEPKQKETPERETSQATEEDNKSEIAEPEAGNPEQIQNPESKEPKQKKRPGREKSKSKKPNRKNKPDKKTS